ncbi:MAG: hypothetical protein Q9177_004941, partial [Variospora cf. flavescens]
ELPTGGNLEPAFKKQKLGHEATTFSGPQSKHPTTEHPKVRTSSISERYIITLPNTATTVPAVFPPRLKGRQWQDQIQSQNAAIKQSLRGLGEVQTRPFLPDSPSLAPRYLSSIRSSKIPRMSPGQPSLSIGWQDIADFAPWGGDHTEDVLSESTLKQGFYEKVQVSQTESSNARPSVWGSVKHQSGLPMLSALVISMLDQRQAHSTTTVGCTFKPPPRVTLTDGKREAWLRDLANSAIPLRKLSRTIPHGIRGRALLDQCLGKSIPMARSLWLAKCVGANEIRAFKRKGASGAFAVGGENKWIREWTTNVEQFLDETIKSCSSSIECQSTPDLYSTVKIKIVDLIKTLIVSSPASFLLPKVWQKYKFMLQAVIGAADTALYDCFEAICKRNARLQSIAGSDKDIELRVHQIVVKTLDATISASVDITEVAQVLLSVQHNATLLVQDCLEWCTSLSRCRLGKARIYVAARLLGELSGIGIDIEIPIINFITASPRACGLDLSSFYAVIAELIRTRHFSVGRYLQWVIANGILSHYDASEVQSCGVGLIFALPMDDVPAHAQNLRQNLLRSVGFSMEDEKHSIAKMKAVVDRRLRDIFFAIGTADQLFTQIFRQQATLEDQDGRSSLLEALIDLAKCMLNRSKEILVLQHDLQKYDSKPSVAACSPISDHMIEAFHSEVKLSVPASSDEVEQLLASGMSMDKHLLGSVFDLIWKRFEATWGDYIQSSVASALLISRLCSFDLRAVDEMMMLRIDKTFLSESRPRLMQIGLPLVCAKSISLEKFLGRVLRYLNDSEANEVYEKLLIESIELLIAEKQDVNSSVNYRYYHFFTQRESLIRSCSPIMKALLQLVLRSVKIAQAVFAANTCTVVQFFRLLSMLQMLLSAVAPGATTPDPHGLEQVLGFVVTRERTGVIIRNTEFPEQDGTPDLHACRQDGLRPLLLKVGILSLPTSCLYLQGIIKEKSESGENTSELIVSTMLGMVSSSSTLQTELWAIMISALPSEQRTAIRDRAESEFFALLANESDPQLSEGPKLIQCLLPCLNRAGEDVHTAASASRIMAQIHESLARLTAWLHLFGPTTIAGNVEDSSSHLKLDALIRLLYIHESAFHIPNVSESKIRQVLVLLSILVVQPLPALYIHISNDICDFLVTLVEHLSPAMYSHCIHTLHNQYHINDSRFDYIYGYDGSKDNKWIQLQVEATSTRKAARQAFPIRRWETLPDATPLMTENDTSISLTLFGARKAVL